MIKFDEKTHTYTLEGRKLISVTQLMQKHGLAPNYAGVSTEVLNAKAERGSLIHKEIEDWIRTGKIGFTKELSEFIDYIRKNQIHIISTEKILYNDIVAGTMDLLFEKDGKFIRADHKTTYSLNKDAVSWQLSIYDELDKEIKADAFQVFHFSNKGLEVVDVPAKPNEAVKRLMDCERAGILYQEGLVPLHVNLEKVQELETVIAKLDQQKKEAEKQQQEFKDALLKEMEERGLKSFENEALKITYVAEQTRTMIDSNKLKKEMPEIVDKYTKETKVKPSVRITLKGEQ